MNMEAPQMYKAASRKISIFLAGFILLAWAAIVPPSLSIAGMHELSDRDMAAISATGFSNFTLDGTGLATLNFDGIGISTYTDITSLKMGYYDNGLGLGWDQDWQDKVGTGKNSLGTSSNDLIFKGLYIKAQFTNYTNPTTRQLEYIKIGTPGLTGDISGYFNSLSASFGSLTGTNVYVDNGAPVTYSGVPMTYSRNMVSMSSGSSPSLTTITATNTSFYLDRTGVGTGNPKGFSMNWGTATIH
jgi:hypothetical protein